MSIFTERLLPKRIGSQIALLVVTSVLLAHVAVAMTFLVMGPVLRHFDPPEFAIVKLTYTAGLLNAAAVEQTRADIVQAARNSLPDLQLTDRLPSGWRALDFPPIKDIEAGLGDGFKIVGFADDGAGRTVRLGVRLPNGKTLTARLPRVPLAPTGVSPLLLGTLVFLASAIALLTLWAAKTLIAPLTSFADAAERFTVGRSDAPLSERGPREISRVARALNGMRERIQSLVDDRARMLAAVGHDLRTPITRLRLRAENIQPEQLRHQVVQDLETMHKLVESALSFFRGQAERSHRVTIDLLSLIQTVCDGYGELGGEVDVVGPGHHLYVDGDPDHLTRAFGNLIENALKFGDKVRIDVRTTPDQAIEIFIEDNGPGIPDGDKRRVLEPFYRGDAARSLNNQDSFGLGLSIACAVITAHDGSMVLHDAQPTGLRICIRLPRKLTQETKPAILSLPGEEAGTETLTSGSL